MSNYNYILASSLEEAQNLLLQHKDKASILNGGTDLLVRMREGHSKPEYIVDIKNIDKSMKEITINDTEIVIGACVLMSQVENDPYIKENFKFLSDACGSVGSWQVRNRATMIGNIVNASPLADSATPLLCLDSIVHVYSNGKMKQIPLSEFFIFVRKTALVEGDIVTAISFPNKKSRGVFNKISRRKEVDLSTVCSTIVCTEGKYKIAFGSVAPTPLRLKKTEEFLLNNEFTKENINRAAEIGSEEVSPIDDIRASANFRKTIVKNIINSSLDELGGNNG